MLGCCVINIALRGDDMTIACTLDKNNPNGQTERYLQVIQKLHVSFKMHQHQQKPCVQLKNIFQSVTKCIFL